MNENEKHEPLRFEIVMGWEELVRLVRDEKKKGGGGEEGDEGLRGTRRKGETHVVSAGKSFAAAA